MALLLLLLFFLILAQLSSACSNICGDLQVTYPFGVETGCGVPDYQLIGCAAAAAPQLPSGLAVSSINYTSRTISIANASISSSSSPNSNSSCSLNALPSSSSLRYCGGGQQQQQVLCLRSNSGCCIRKDSSSSSNSSDGCSTYSPGGSNSSAYIDLQQLQVVWSLSSNNNSSCANCTASRGQCGYNSTAAFLCICPGGAANSTTACAGGGASTNNKPIILSGTLAVVIIVVVLVFGVSLSIYWKWKKNGRGDGDDAATSPHHEQPIFPMEDKQTINNISGNTKSNLVLMNNNLREMMLSKRGEAARVFSLAEVERATQGFDNANRIGSGGFGTVYKGTFDGISSSGSNGGGGGGGTVMAVKRANHSSRHSSQHFLNEVTVLSQVNHRHLVRLVGCCIDTDVPMLVYEYVPNGTLFDHLHGRRAAWGRGGGAGNGGENGGAGKGGGESGTPGGGVLSWKVRLRIALETAEALAYLHSAALPPIYHRDVKSSNILLDFSFTAKVADFGLSRLVPEDATHVSTMVQGTPGYVDPEYYQTYQLTDKSDVYSFGVVLLELVTGRKPVDFSRSSRDVNLSAYSLPLIRQGMVEELMDPRLLNHSDNDGGDNEELLRSVRGVANLAVSCLAFFREDRPTMKQVVETLLAIRGSTRLGNENGLNLSEREEQRQQQLTSSWLVDDYSDPSSSTARNEHSTELTPR